MYENRRHERNVEITLMYGRVVLFVNVVTFYRGLDNIIKIRQKRERERPLLSDEMLLPDMLDLAKSFAV